MRSDEMKKVLILARSAPYGNVLCAESFLAGIALRSMDMDVKLVLFNDGVFAALKGQKAELIGHKSVEEALSSAPDFDLPVYIHGESIQERGIDASQLISAEIINTDALKDMVKTADAIMNF